MKNETSATYKAYAAFAAARRGSAQLSRVRRGWLAAWAAAMALLGWALMTLGAFVRASESGLGCPDWPACHGQLVAGGHHAMIEEFHRWVATMLVVGVVALALMVFRGYRHERRVTRPMVWVLALLALQVVLGGVTVLLRNVSWTVVLHYGGAALLVASITLVAVRLVFPTAEPAPHDSFSRRSDGSLRSALACCWRARPSLTRTPTRHAVAASRCATDPWSRPSTITSSSI